MVEIEVEPNPNCDGVDYHVYQETSPARPVKMMRLGEGDKARLYWITGMDRDGVIRPAYAQKVADSGGGTSFLIYGGAWGIRFKPEEQKTQPWDLKDKRQFGEPFKFYGDEKDIIYEEA